MYKKESKQNIQLGLNTILRYLPKVVVIFRVLFRDFALFVSVNLKR